MVDPVDMQTILAAAALSIVEGKPEVIAAVEPLECLAGVRKPIVIPRGFIRLKAGAHHRSGLDRLLVKLCRRFPALPKAVGTNRAEMSFRRNLVFRKPAQAFETDLTKGGQIRPPACHNQSVRESRIVVADDVLKP